LLAIETPEDTVGKIGWNKDISGYERSIIEDAGWSVGASSGLPLGTI